MDYQLTAPSRHCILSGREILPGEKYFAALLDENGNFVRRDYAVESWQGPPQGAIAFWQSKIPLEGATRKPVYNDSLLMDWFLHLANETEPSRQRIRYVVALLLMRRKRLKFEDLRRDAGQDTMLLRDAKSGSRYEIADLRLSETEIAAVQEEVFRALGW